MADPRPILASSDGEVILQLVELSRDRDDPRMNSARFKVRGPQLEAESTIDAYMLEDLFEQVASLVGGERRSASSILGELTFEKVANGEINVSLGLGPYRGDAERSWVCTFAASSHEVGAFAVGLAAEFAAAGVPAN